MDVTVVVATFGSILWRAFGDAAAQQIDTAKLVRIHGRGDIASARNAGLARVDTKWVCFLDADDALAPGYFEAMDRGAADVRQPAVAGWGPRQMVPTCGAPHRAPGHAPETECLQFGNPLCVGAVVRTKLVREVGGFDPRWPVIEDYALWRAIALKGATFEAIPEAVYLARVRRNPAPRNQIGGRALRADTHKAIDQALPWT